MELTLGEAGPVDAGMAIGTPIAGIALGYYAAKHIALGTPAKVGAFALFAVVGIVLGASFAANKGMTPFARPSPAAGAAQGSAAPTGQGAPR